MQTTTTSSSASSSTTQPIAGSDLPPPTAESLKSQWNAFAPIFTDKLQPLTDQTALSLATHLHLGDPSVRSVVEIGSGGGGGTEIVFRMKNPDAKLVACDLSDAFLELAKKRMAGTDVEFHEANAEHLPFDDASFDRYFANFVVHLVTDPKQMLKESRRVLRPGGMAGFTVWGRAAKSPQFTIMPKVTAELGIPSGPKTRSNFHLGADPQLLRQMALDAGFSRALAWYQMAMLPASNADEAVEYLTIGPQVKQMIEGLDPAVRKRLLDRLREVCDEHFEQGQKIGLDTLYMVAMV